MEGQALDANVGAVPGAGRPTVREAPWLPGTCPADRAVRRFHSRSCRRQDTISGRMGGQSGRWPGDFRAGNDRNAGGCRTSAGQAR